MFSRSAGVGRRRSAHEATRVVEEGLRGAEGESEGRFDESSGDRRPTVGPT